MEPRCHNCGSVNILLQDIYGREFDRDEKGIVKVVRHVEVPVCIDCNTLVLKKMSAIEILDEASKYIPLLLVSLDANPFNIITTTESNYNRRRNMKW